MKKILILTILAGILCGCGGQQTNKGFLSKVADGAWWVLKTTAKGSAINRNNPYSYPYSSGLITQTAPNSYMNLETGNMWVRNGNSIMDMQTGDLSTILNDGSIMNLDTGTIFQKTGSGYMNMDTGQLTFVVPR